MAMDVEFALQELLAKLAEQNIKLEIRKVPDKELIYEIKMPEKLSPGARVFSQGGVFARQLSDQQTRVDEEERLHLQANLLGVGQL